MNTPLAIERRATCVGDLQETFCHIDARRWDWAALVFEELGRPVAAERAREFAEEHRLTADRLRGAE
jgi:hypothetical protein